MRAVAARDLDRLGAGWLDRLAGLDRTDLHRASL